jgi:hypothetical protein
VKRPAGLYCPRHHPQHRTGKGSTGYDTANSLDLLRRGLIGRGALLRLCLCFRNAAPVAAFCFSGRPSRLP